MPRLSSPPKTIAMAIRLYQNLNPSIVMRCRIIEADRLFKAAKLAETETQQRTIFKLLNNKNQIEIRCICEDSECINRISNDPDSHDFPICRCIARSSFECSQKIIGYDSDYSLIRPPSFEFTNGEDE